MTDGSQDGMTSEAARRRAAKRDGRAWAATQQR